jgi:DNA-binding IclR family transcriptional regulator
MIQVLSRSADILHYVAESDKGLRLYELTELMNLQRSTVHNVAASLISIGMLTKDETSRYRLGPLFRELYLEQCKSRLYTYMRGLMLHLSELINGSTLTYTEFKVNEIISIFRISADQPRKIHIVEGSAMNPYYTVSGLLHFALLPDSKLNLLKLRYPFIPGGQELWGSEQRFNDEIENCRKRGYALIPIDPPNSFRLGIPIRQNGGFAGTLTWSKSNFSESEKKTMLKEAMRIMASGITEAENFEVNPGDSEL